MKILIIDGSLGGNLGNTAKALDVLKKYLGADVDTAVLSDGAPIQLDAFRARLMNADAFVFATGVYWDSWGSPLQKFFEDATELEGDSCWLGKPAALITTMHSVGGKEVLNRLHGVINTFGLYVPPMCAFTYSLANQLALENKTAPGSENESFKDDLWRLSDLEIIASNLTKACAQSQKAPTKWSSWPIDKENPRRLWLKTI